MSYENGKFRIVGRSSVDIIKSRSFKIGALDIEGKLLNHKEIREVAILGVPDDLQGEKVACLIAPKSQDKKLTLEELKDWCWDKMPHYHIPSELLIVDSIPRNAMGKVNKKELIKMFS